MKLILLIMIFTVSCSKTTEDSSGVNQLIKNGTYFATQSNLSVTEYSSTNIRVFEINNNRLVVTMGVAQNFKVATDGSVRTGSLPDPKLNYTTASYNLIKKNGKIFLDFISSSCEFQSKNPFSDIYNTEFDVLSTESSIVIDLGNDIKDELFKVETGEIIDFFSYYTPVTATCLGI